MTATPLTGLRINRGLTNATDLVVFSKSAKMISHSVRQIVNMCLMSVFHCQVIYFFMHWAIGLKHVVIECIRTSFFVFLCILALVSFITMRFTLLALGQSYECCSASEEYGWTSPLNIIKCEYSSTKTTTKKNMYCKISNVRCTLIGNGIVDHSDVVGASPVGAAPTTSSF